MGGFSGLPLKTEADWKCVMAAFDEAARTNLQAALALFFFSAFLAISAAAAFFTRAPARMPCRARNYLRWQAYS